MLRFGVNLNKHCLLDSPQEGNKRVGGQMEAKDKRAGRRAGLDWGQEGSNGGAGGGRQGGWVAGRVDGGMPLGAFKNRRFAKDVRQKVKNTSSKNTTFAKSEHPYRISGPAWSSSACHEPPKSLNLGCNFANFRSEN